MNDYKILFTGPTGSGKTTIINTISEVTPINTDVSCSNLDREIAASGNAAKKVTVTVGFDYGELILDLNTRLRLYGVPGQVRFDFFSEIIIKGSSGIILLIDSSNALAPKQLLSHLEKLKGKITNIPCIIGLTKTETHSLYSLKDIQLHLNEIKFARDIDIQEVNIHDKSSILFLLNLFLKKSNNLN